MSNPEAMSVEERKKVRKWEREKSETQYNNGQYIRLDKKKFSVNNGQYIHRDKNKT